MGGNAFSIKRSVLGGPVLTGVNKKKLERIKFELIFLM